MKASRSISCNTDNGRSIDPELQAIDAAAYNAWYDTPRGRWIGDIEFRLLGALLMAEPGESLIDIGCGTGYFARRFAADAGLDVAGLDPSPRWIDFARTHGVGPRYCLGRAEALPFADRSFDYAISVAALCFIVDPRTALREMLRVTRKRIAVGLLNRRSVLYLQKGRCGGAGAYRGAHWHTAKEIRALFAGRPAANLVLRTAVMLPGGSLLARGIERLVPGSLPFGGFIAAAADVVTRSGSRARTDTSS
jgi:SAM-dependent methyltransferase